MVTNHYDVMLRRTNLALQGGSGTISQAGYGYDAASRLASVSDIINGNSAAYSYLANSSLVSNITFKQSSTTRMTTTKQYDYLNRLTSIASVGSASGASPVSYTYQYNDANQRTIVREGDWSYWRYDYDTLGQVTGGKRYWDDQTLVAGQQFEYGFDTIGNRLWTEAGGDQFGANLRYASYTNNSLNQITSRDVPGAVDIMGLALATNGVTINGLTPYRKNEYFREQLTAANSGGPVWTNITVSSPGQGTVTGHQYVAQTPETFSYDADGNLIQDGRWNYTWDGENRLVGMTSLSGAPTGSQCTLNFVYDYMSRRIAKMVSTNGSGYTNYFLYDGWNCIDVLGLTLAPSNTFMWGIDLSGTTKGAGSVGGLLDSSASGTNTFVAHDGNGNVRALINATDGTTVANYDYGPFAEVIRATGPMAESNPFRFSTKYTDDETDFLYYGYRYYNSSTGRWLARDPLDALSTAEARFDLLDLSGIDEHLAATVARQNSQLEYVFACNTAINQYDVFGLWCAPLAPTGPGVLNRVSEWDHKVNHGPPNTLTFTACCPSQFMELTKVQADAPNPVGVWSPGEPVSTWTVHVSPTSPGCYTVVVDVAWHAIIMNPIKAILAIRLNGTCCSDCALPMSASGE